MRVSDEVLQALAEARGKGSFAISIFNNRAVYDVENTCALVVSLTPGVAIEDSFTIHIPIDNGNKR